MLYSPPIQSQKLLNWPEVREQSTNKIENMLSQVTYVYTFLPIYGSKVKIQMAESFFGHLESWHLMAQQTA